MHRWTRAAVLVTWAGGVATGAAGGDAAAQPAPPATAPVNRFRIGTIRPAAVRECSGIVASRRHAGVFWVLNDSGNPPALYAITREGELIGEYAVRAQNVDWEDLAIDDAGHLYIADVGNNTGGRKEVQVLRVDEPDPRAPLPAAAAGAPPMLRVNAALRLRYPAAPFDCEALFVLGGRGYVIPKRVNAAPAELYRFDLTPPAAPAAVTLERVAELPMVRAPVTAADVSPDGKRLAVLTVLGPYVIDLDDGDVARAGTSPTRSARYVHPLMEAACFVTEGLLVTTESRDVLLFRDGQFTDVQRKP